MSMSVTSAAAAAKPAVAAAAAETAGAADAAAASSSSSKSASSVTSSGGVFMITGSDGKSHAIDMGTLMMMVNVEYVGAVDMQLEDLVGVMEERNFEIEVATEVMSTIRTYKADGKDPDDVEIPIDGTTKTVSEWCSYLGLSYTSVSGSRPSDDDKADTWDAKLEANIQNIKSAIDLLNNDSEIDSIRLENLMDKRSNALEQASNLMKSHNESVETVNNNL